MTSRATPEEITAAKAKVLERLGDGATLVLAALSADIADSTIRHWIAKDADFATAYHRIMDARPRYALGKVVTKGR